MAKADNNICELTIYLLISKQPISLPIKNRVLGFRIFPIYLTNINCSNNSLRFDNFTEEERYFMADKLLSVLIVLVIVVFFGLAINILIT